MPKIYVIQFDGSFALMDRVSPKKAIENHCKDCLYDKSQDGTWRLQVERCTSPECALYSNRPVTQAATNRRRKTAK